ncbi:MAG: hypothetical protein Q9220_003804 [cf. Caloplaca sp. 1 TL-2023]
MTTTSEEVQHTMKESHSSPPPSETLVVGRPPKFWLYNSHDGFDLTYPDTPSSPKVHPRVTMKTTTTPITIAPSKTALVIVDMQNYFFSAALDNSEGGGLKAQEVLLRDAIPAARKAGIQIIWLNWGLTEEDLDSMPPTTWRAFGFNIFDDAGAKKERKDDIDLGADLGTAKLDDGTIINRGRKLMRDQWNTALHGPLEDAYRSGLSAKIPDVWIHKTRLSGMWAEPSSMTDFLNEQGIQTLLFTGVNTDQCVLSTLQDACHKGWDTILLEDGCGTTSPAYAREAVLFNCEKPWGFVSSCKDLAHAVQSTKSAV